MRFNLRIPVPSFRSSSKWVVGGGGCGFERRDATSLTPGYLCQHVLPQGDAPPPPPTLTLTQPPSENQLEEL